VDIIHNYVFNKVSSFQSDEEVKNMMSGCVLKANNVTGICSTFLPPANLNVPATVDWRTKGYVTPVKNQVHSGGGYS
jgi:cathepsin L